MRLRLRGSPVLTLTLACLVLVCAGLGCAKAPPTLSPSGAAAWYALQVGKDLDLLRDVAIAANAKTPPLLSESTTRAVVEYHKLAVAAMVLAPDGWKASVSAGLRALEIGPQIPDAERAVIVPYLRLLGTVLASVP